MEESNINFKQILETETEKLLVKFSTKWCGPCKTYGPIFDKFTTNNPSIKTLYIDCNEEPDIAHKFNVMSIPTTMIIKNNKELCRKTGILNEDDLLKLLE